MSNPNVRKQLDKIAGELDNLGRHVVQYSGISAKDAHYVQNACSQIVQMAGRLIEEAELVERAGGGGVSPGRGKRGVVKKLRKALGFTYP